MTAKRATKRRKTAKPKAPPSRLALARRARAADVDKRQCQAFELRLCGHTLREIKERCGFETETQALAALAKEAKRQEAVTALHIDEDRRLDLARAELLLTGVMAAAVKGHMDAQRRALDLLRYRADVLGLCAPVKAQIKAEVTGPGGGPLQLQVIVVPGVASIEQWRAAAGAHLARVAALPGDGE